MEGKQTFPADPMIAPVYYQPGPTPYPNTMAYPVDNANQVYLPPPAYNVATIPQPQLGNVQQVGFQGGYVSQNATVIQAVGVISTLRKESVQVNCTNCQRTGFTRVESKIANHGWIWAIVCFFCGSWLLSLLIFCIDAFKEFLHYCPFCNSMIGVYKPQFAGGVIALLILLPIGFIIIQIVILVAVVLPMIYHANNQFDNFNNYGYN